MRRFIRQHFEEFERSTNLLGMFFLGGVVFAVIVVYLASLYRRRVIKG